MKTIPLLSAVAVALAVASSYANTDSGTAATQGYLTYGSSTALKDGDFFGGPHRWSFGVAMDHEARSVEVDGFKEGWQNDTLMAYVGYDPLSWMTIQGGVGQSHLQLEDEPGSRDQKVEWNLGLRLRLLEYMIVNPPVGDQPYWLGIETLGRYSRGISDGGSGRISWNQWDAALTAHLSTKPERFDVLNKIDLFAGPALSLIDGKRNDFFGTVDIREEQAIGIVGGLNFLFGDNFTLGLHLSHFGDLGYGADLSFHF